MNPNDIVRHELIGLSATVSHASNNALNGTRGVVVDESKNMLTLSDGKRKIIIPKNTVTLRFKLRDGTRVEVAGNRLVGRPENRLKTKVRRW